MLVTYKLMIRHSAWFRKLIMKLIMISWIEHRPNQSIREEIQVEEQWLENFQETKAEIFWSF